MNASMLPTGPFGCLLADPPWAFGTYSNRTGTTPHRGKDDHYSVMSFDQLAALPVGSVAAKDYALFMWVVDSHLDAALRLGEAWGFRFKTCAFVWFKSRNEGVVPKISMGYWTRKQTEQCWLFTRGRPPRLSKGIRQAIFCERGLHSAKPDEQYERIEALVAGPYLELFARLSRPGWTAWGDQSGSRDTLFGKEAVA
ncbi:MT-A70 family methyltransferase [Mesorhizobium captivum]|uniref:MT-A70 family methyltransferase n=1 Tax=Mesorhizobium captivum TaxID=3072319 RepID=UPI002A24292D|nr:MT-A70 family methyltransferase [Mesorhizobium sp. VK3C]MDX8450702.1 MT-A70 family methyltransferase [Mesorhizobium sp. VK3C]